MRGPAPAVNSASMTPTSVPVSVPVSAPPRRRVRPAAVVLLVLTVALASLVVDISYGLALEYGDTAAADVRIAAQALRDWGIGVVLVVGCAGCVDGGRAPVPRPPRDDAGCSSRGRGDAGRGARRRRARRAPEARPPTRTCRRAPTGFRTGPAVPVVRAAQAGFEELDHPGPFSGGGSSGVDGCSSQLMVAADVDVPALLPAHAEGQRLADQPRRTGPGGGEQGTVRSSRRPATRTARGGCGSVPRESGRSRPHPAK